MPEVIPPPSTGEFDRSLTGGLSVSRLDEPTLIYSVKRLER